MVSKEKRQEYNRRYYAKKTLQSLKNKSCEPVVERTEVITYKKDLTIWELLVNAFWFIRSKILFRY